MRELDINKLKKKEDFLIKENKRSLVGFSTSENSRSFNRNTEEGIKALESIKNEFNVDSVVFLNQIHSDYVLTYDGKEDFNKNEGDAIITDIKNVAIGVFTADCVPVILVNEDSGVIGAIHSGWKGTFNSITKKTLKKMSEEFSVNHKNTKAYIGAHIMDCCYEISEELKDKFIIEKSYVKDLFNGKNLNMQNCIINDLIEFGVQDTNINLLNKCTYCSDDIKLHSYRKSIGSYGRMFTFAILR